MRFVFLAASLVAVSLVPAAHSAAAASQAPPPPRIVSLTTSASHVKSGDTFTISVVANSSVTRVTANFANQKLPLCSRSSQPVFVLV